MFKMSDTFGFPLGLGEGPHLPESFHFVFQCQVFSWIGGTMGFFSPSLPTPPSFPKAVLWESDFSISKAKGQQILDCFRAGGAFPPSRGS